MHVKSIKVSDKSNSSIIYFIYYYLLCNCFYVLNIKYEYKFIIVHNSCIILFHLFIVYPKQNIALYIKLSPRFLKNFVNSGNEIRYNFLIGFNFVKARKFYFKTTSLK